MKFMESHFWYNKSQRNGILFLFIILFTAQALLYFVDFSDDNELNEQQFALIQYKIDSLKSIKPASNHQKRKAFNPNYISDFKAYQLGLSVDEADRLFAFRQKGKFVNSAREFQRITGVNDSLFRLISPYFKFPRWTQGKDSKTKKPAVKESPDRIRDLNKATTEEIETIEGVDLKMAKRIIAYRNYLKGYTTNEQLHEVYDLKKETALRLRQYFKVIEKPDLLKVNINTASFKELLRTPYLDYKLTKKICAFRDDNEFFQNLNDLKKIDSFPVEKFDRIALYLCAE